MAQGWFAWFDIPGFDHSGNFEAAIPKAPLDLES
jgi:hypothetical protein